MARQTGRILPYNHALPLWRVAASVLALAGVTAAVLRWFRPYTYLAAGWFWYLGTLVPVIGLVQVGGQSSADRYTYVPMVGLAIMLSWGAADLLKRRPAHAGGHRGVRCVHGAHLGSGGLLGQ